MNRLVKLFRLLISTVMLAAFALPANAAKTITLSATPVPAPLSSLTTSISVIIANTGNSNANSFEIDWSTSPYFKVTEAMAGDTAGSCSPTGSKPGYASCVFLKQLPTKDSVTVTLTVEVTNQCTPMSIDWYAYAWTGAPGSVSQSFALQGTAPRITSTPNCTIKFVTPPKDTFVGWTITGSPFNSMGAPVTVQLLQGGTGVPGKTVTLSAVPASCATTSTSTATTDSSGTVTLNFTAAAAESCQLRAEEPVYGLVDSPSFNVVQPTGSLGCTAGTNTFPLTTVGPLPALGSTRLPNVDDPAPDAVGGETAPECEIVPYVVETTCPTGLTGTCVNFIYDPLNQGTHMAFAFHWEWPAEAIPSEGISGIDDTLQLFLNGNPVPLALDLCPEIIPLYASNGSLIGLDPSSPPPNDQDFPSGSYPGLPGTQAGCLVRRVVKQVGGQVQIVEDAYVQGDYASARN
jgi:hypothetical protein